MKIVMVCRRGFREGEDMKSCGRQDGEFELEVGGGERRESVTVVVGIGIGIGIVLERAEEGKVS